MRDEESDFQYIFESITGSKENESVNRILDYLESTEFHTKVSVFSGAISARMFIMSDENVVKLIDICKSNPVFIQKLFVRLAKIVSHPIDMNFEHPQDVTLAAYKVICSEVNIDLGNDISEILNEVPNLFWAKKI